MASTRAERATLVAPINARTAVSSSRSIDYPPKGVVAHSFRNGAGGSNLSLSHPRAVMTWVCENQGELAAGFPTSGWRLTPCRS